MDLVAVIILGIVQGVAEFLPISSSGHLVIVEALFESAGGDLPHRLMLNVVLHGGTLLAILVFYRRRVFALLGTERRAVGLLIIGTLPAGVAGLILERRWPHLLESPLLAGAMLIVTGFLLIWARRHNDGHTTYAQISYRQALLVGLAQVLGLLPGMSRSGVTIVAGMATGLRPEAAATFSFLLAIPAIAGACLLELLKVWTNGGPEMGLSVLAVGAATSFAVGLASLWWLLRWIDRGWLYRFAFWCIPLGMAVMGWQLSRLPAQPTRRSDHTNPPLETVGGHLSAVTFAESETRPGHRIRFRSFEPKPHWPGRSGPFFIATAPARRRSIPQCRPSSAAQPTSATARPRNSDVARRTDFL